MYYSQRYQAGKHHVRPRWPRQVHRFRLCHCSAQGFGQHGYLWITILYCSRGSFRQLRPWMRYLVPWRDTLSAANGRYAVRWIGIAGSIQEDQERCLQDAEQIEQRLPRFDCVNANGWLDEANQSNLSSKAWLVQNHWWQVCNKIDVQGGPIRIGQRHSKKNAVLQRIISPEARRRQRTRQASRG